ncbi:hypothetical protein RintRC_1182 [Richelia intracellularis]|nr:hypothetical protein RintRC_1182 [Richelia intracellularis]
MDKNPRLKTIGTKNITIDNLATVANSPLSSPPLNAAVIT